MSSNDKNSSGIVFDINDILSEFASLDEEPVSAKPVFELKGMIKDESDKQDIVFSSLIGDDIESAPEAESDAGLSPEDFGFERAQIIDEFYSQDSVSEDSPAIDPESIRREFDLEDGAAPSSETKEPEAEKHSEAQSETDDILDEVDRIIAEFRNEPQVQESVHIIEPSPPSLLSRSPQSAVSRKSRPPPNIRNPNRSRRRCSSANRKRTCRSRIFTRDRAYPRIRRTNMRPMPTTPSLSPSRQRRKSRAESPDLCTNP